MMPGLNREAKPNEGMGLIKLRRGDGFDQNSPEGIVSTEAILQDDALEGWQRKQSVWGLV